MRKSSTLTSQWSESTLLTVSFEAALAVALTTAIQRGDGEALQTLLRDNPGIAAARIVDRHGVARTLLHVVADWPGHFPNGARAVQMLVAAGADVNAGVIHPGPNGSPETALHWAASSNDVSVLDALLDSGADIEAPGAVFTGGTPLSDAVLFTQWRAANRLVERGAKTTIWQAAALGLLNRVRECRSIEPPGPSEEITNAFWHACRAGQLGTAEYLLDQGAELNWVGHDGKTPLDAAQNGETNQLTPWLRELGAEQGIGSSRDG